MCDPITLMAAAAGGKIAQGIGGFMSGNLSSEMASNNAKLLGVQAQIAGGNADLAVTRGNYDEFLARRKGASVLATEKNIYAGGNVDPSYGSPLATQGYSASQIETNAQLIRAKMMGERADALTQEANIEGQSAAQQFKSVSDKTQAITSLVSGVLGAAGSFSGLKTPAATPDAGGSPMPLGPGTDFLTRVSTWAGLGGAGGPVPSVQSGNAFLAGNPWGIY